VLKEDHDEMFLRVLKEIREQILPLQPKPKNKLLLKSWDRVLEKQKKQGSNLVKRKSSTRFRTAFPKMYQQQILNRRDLYLLRVMKEVFTMLQEVEKPLSLKEMF